jgi:inorganic pyrophosphatase
MNLWHDIDPGSPGEMNVIVENPRGSKNKYEIDKETGMIALDRVLHTAQDFPVEYGFIPKTLWDDGDAVDAILLSTYPFHPGILVRMRAVGLVKMIDSGENDYKILGVPAKDPRWDHVQDLEDVNKHTIKEIEHFFTTYKQIQKKEVVIEGFGTAAEARDAFARGQKLYTEKFGK